MTVQLVKRGLIDKVLRLIGKRRAFYIPFDNSQYGYSQPYPESIFRTLLRPAGQPLPEGMFYMEDAAGMFEQSGK